MFNHSTGVVAIGICLSMIGFAPKSSAQTVTSPAVQDSGLIRTPAPWDKSMKFFPDDFRRLEMGTRAEKQTRIQIGPVELESRKSAGNNDAPWRPNEPYFQQSHTAFSWSFDIHRSHR